MNKYRDVGAYRDSKIVCDVHVKFEYHITCRFVLNVTNLYMYIHAVYMYKYLYVHVHVHVCVPVCTLCICKVLIIYV